VDEQVARQRLGQHKFITVFTAVYIQGLYTVYNGAGVQSTVAVLGLAQQAKYIERWPCPTRLLPELAGADLIFQWIGMVEYIPS
jgi:hypothetical protein